MLIFSEIYINCYRENGIGDEGAIELGKAFVFLPKNLNSFTLDLTYYKKFIYFYINDETISFGFNNVFVNFQKK